MSFEPVDFPAVTFCNLNSIVKSKARLGGKQLRTVLQDVEVAQERAITKQIHDKALSKAKRKQKRSSTGDPIGSGSSMESSGEGRAKLKEPATTPGQRKTKITVSNITDFKEDVNLSSEVWQQTTLLDSPNSHVHQQNSGKQLYLRFANGQNQKQHYSPDFSYPDQQHRIRREGIHPYST